ncbi:hypothetical protein BH24CHL7_BH24CHL7_02080 [soil metagenome]
MNMLSRIADIPIGEEVYLTVPEVAHLLGRSEQLVRRWIRAGDLPAERMTDQPGNPWAIPMSTFTTAAAALSVRKRRGVTRTPAEMQRAKGLARHAARPPEGASP